MSQPRKQTKGIMKMLKSLLNQVPTMHALSYKQRSLGNVDVTLHQSDKSATVRRLIPLKSCKAIQPQGELGARDFTISTVGN